MVPVDQYSIMPVELKLEDFQNIFNFKKATGITSKSQITKVELHSHSAIGDSDAPPSANISSTPRQEPKEKDFTPYFVITASIDKKEKTFICYTSNASSLEDIANSAEYKAFRSIWASFA